MNYPHIFGVRHLSPAGGYHLKQFLNDINPEIVLIEGLSDASDEILHLTKKGTKLPIAILAYTEELPIKTLIYPMAEYSPEYQAIVWANNNSKKVEFIDLPSNNFLAISHSNNVLKKTTNDESEALKESRVSIYNKISQLSGESDYETYWERNFEHNYTKDSYRLAISEFGSCLRDLSKDNEYEIAENSVREAYMRYKINKALEEFPAEKIVVIVGAYHVEALTSNLQPMTESEIKQLPSMKSKLTLMPYSYYRLSSQSGYGAGNHCPNYYQLLWESLQENNMSKLPSKYFVEIVRYLRTKGTFRSTAEVIEAMRLSTSLSAMHSGAHPTLKDLRDATITILGQGELSVVAQGIQYVEIGNKIGSLPEGVSRTSIQDDFYRELKRLKLEKYKSTAENLKLDLRENRHVKSIESAFIDLNRSFFLHRIKNLDISFAKYIQTKKSANTWEENWVLLWTPESEIELIESALIGETIELASSYKFKQKLDETDKIDIVSEIIREACYCGLLDVMNIARDTLQKLSVANASFSEISKSCFNLSNVITYGDVRKFEKDPFIPLLTQLFLRGALLLIDASNCNNEEATNIIESIENLNKVCQLHYNEVDENLWIKQLQILSDRDDKNPKISGYCCSILLERNLIEDNILSCEVSKRLSPGIEADIGAGWFEGISMRNRYTLLSKIILWNKLDKYISSLNTEEFKRALVFLRRAFGNFTPQEKCHIAENLGEIWGFAQYEATDIINTDLSEDEHKILSELDEFNFDDI